MPKRKTIGLFDFTEKQRIIFSSTLALSEMRLNHEWNIVDAKNAGVIFLNGEGKITQDRLKEIQLSYPHAILVAYHDALVHLNLHWSLLTSSTRPPKISLLVELLNNIDAEPEENISDTNERQAIEPQSSMLSKNDNAIFQAEDYFLGIVQQSINTGKNYYCMGINDTVVYISPKDSNYYCALAITDLEPLFFMAAKDIVVKKITAKKLKQETESLQEKPLNDLLWYSTIIASQGRLMKNRQNNDVVHLKYWPDISQISGKEHYLTIAAFMNNNAVNMSTIAKHTGQKLSDVIDFHNACHVLGLIDDTMELFLHTKPNSDKTRGLRQRILSSLKIKLKS